MNRGEIAIILAYAAVIVIAFATLRSPDADKPISLCPPHQQAQLVGFGLDKHGEYLATYECDRDPAPARSKAVAKK